MNDLQIAVATTLGALLVVVAAWLLVMRRDAGQNRAKLLGFEFELSTPALVVLLIGAGLLIGPPSRHTALEGGQRCSPARHPRAIRARQEAVRSFGSRRP